MAGKDTSKEKIKKPVDLVREHVMRKILNFDKNGMSGSDVTQHKDNLNKKLRKGNI